MLEEKVFLGVPYFFKRRGGGGLSPIPSTPLPYYGVRTFSKGGVKKKKKKDFAKKKIYIYIFFFIWGPYSLKGFPYSEYVLFQRGLACGVKKIFFYMEGLFFKGAPLFRVRPFPLRYVLSSTDFSKGGEVKKFLWSYSLQETLFVSKKNIYIFFYRGGYLSLKGYSPIPSIVPPYSGVRTF